MLREPTRFGLILAAAVALADQATKTWALETWFFPPRVIEVTPFFNLVPVWNTGVSFGFLASDSKFMPYALAGFAAMVTIALVVWLTRIEVKLMAGALGSVIGGAVGNVIDRLRFHAVVDFIDLHVAGFHWPAFNLADSAITIGVMLILLDSFVRRSEEEP